MKRGTLGIVTVLALLQAEAGAAQDAGDVTPAQPGIGLEISGTFQPRVSFGVSDGPGEDLERFGAGIRRARLELVATLPSNVGITYDVDLGGGDLGTVDAFAFWYPREGLRFRAGRFAGAQPRSYVYTSHSRIDAVDRAIIGERWARGTIGSSGRDFGVDAQLVSGGTTFELWLHNGDQSFDRDRSNFRETVRGSATGGVERTALAMSAYVAHRVASVPGLELGGHAGFNGSKNPFTRPRNVEVGRSYATWSGHAYWGAVPGSRPVRLKVDALGVRYEGLEERSVPRDAEHDVGVAVLGALRVAEHGEAFARWERWEPGSDAGAADYLTAGVSYSFGARRGVDYRQQRLTLAWAAGLAGEPDAADQHLLVLQAQILF